MGNQSKRFRCIVALYIMVFFPIFPGRVCAQSIRQNCLAKENSYAQVLAAPIDAEDVLAITMVAIEMKEKENEIVNPRVLDHNAILRVEMTEGEARRPEAVSVEMRVRDKKHIMNARDYMDLVGYRIALGVEITSDIYFWNISTSCIVFALQKVFPFLLLTDAMYIEPEKISPLLHKLTRPIRRFNLDFLSMQWKECVLKSAQEYSVSRETAYSNNELTLALLRAKAGDLLCLYKDGTLQHLAYVEYIGGELKLHQKFGEGYTGRCDLTTLLEVYPAMTGITLLRPRIIQDANEKIFLQDA